MRRKLGAVSTLALGIFLSGWMASSLAQPAPAGDQPGGPGEVVAPEAVEEPEYVFGTVKSVSKDQLVVSEFDYETGEEKEATYWMDPAVELNNVVSVQEIAVGDEVDIDYLIKDGKKVAVVLSVAKPLPEEAVAEEE